MIVKIEISSSADTCEILLKPSFLLEQHFKPKIKILEQADADQIFFNSGLADTVKVMLQGTIFNAKISIA